MGLKLDARLVAILIAVAFPALYNACDAKDREWKAFPDRVVHEVKLPGLTNNRVTALAIGDDGDLVLGVATWAHHGRILRVPRHGANVSIVDTPEPVDSVAIDRNGRPCYVAGLARRVRCLNGRGRATWYGPVGGVIGELVRAGPYLFAFDRESGTVYEVGEGRTRRVATGFQILAFGSDGVSLTVVGTNRRCLIDGATLVRNCTAIAPAIASFGPSAGAVSASGTTFVIDVPKHEVIVISSEGHLVHRPLDVYTQQIAARDRRSVWVGGGGSNDRAQLVVAAVSEWTHRMLAFPARLHGGAIIAAGIHDDLVIVDPDLRVALFLEKR